MGISTGILICFFLLHHGLYVSYMFLVVIDVGMCPVLNNLLLLKTSIKEVFSKHC